MLLKKQTEKPIEEKEIISVLNETVTTNVDVAQIRKDLEKLREDIQISQSKRKKARLIGRLDESGIHVVTDETSLFLFDQFKLVIIFNF